MLKSSINLNHLAFADDTIIFAYTHSYSLRKIMTILQEYEKQSGQKLNKDKTFIIYIKMLLQSFLLRWNNVHELLGVLSLWNV